MIGRTLHHRRCLDGGRLAMRFNDAAAKHPDSGKDWFPYLAPSMRTIFDSGVVNLNVTSRSK
jgi:hypothetical protein